MSFDNAFVEQVRGSIDILEVVHRYVALKQKGKDFGALCPFHSEKTPSFWVSPSKQIFKCFGCGAGGDVFGFIMQIEGLSFPESIRFIADMAGVRMPEQSARSRQEFDERERLLSLMEAVARFFRECLRTHERGGLAREYLKKREIAAETAAQFGMGYAPPGNVLLQWVRDQGFRNEDAIACGLAKRNDAGRVYCYFRDRVLLPIRDLSGRTIAFGGRVLADGEPKYLNSPETKLYSKGRHLFGMDLARNEIRQRDFAILVEGYFDCIVPAQFGVANIVASLGTSLTQDQVRLLGRYSRNIVVSYDPDLAGQNAAQRSIEMLMQEGFQVRVMRLPEGSDPDDFIRAEGAEAYRLLLDESQGFLDFLLEKNIRAQEDPFGPRGRKEIVTALLPYLRKVADKIERAGYISHAAARLRMDERLLLAELRQMAARGSSAAAAPDDDEGVTAAEKVLLAAAFDDEHREAVVSGAREDLFSGLVTESLFRRIFSMREQGQEISVPRLCALIEDERLVDLIERLALGRSSLPLTGDAVRGSLASLELRRTRHRRKEIEARMSQTDDFDEQKRCLSEIQGLAREERDLTRRQGSPPN